MSETVVKTRAIVAHAPQTDPVAPTWKMEELEVNEIGDNDLLVEMAATGICHTDVALSCLPDKGPWVPGHEGGGKVLKVGKNVKKAQVGDPVLMSFTSCKSCWQCDTHHPAYCPQFTGENMGLLNAKFKRPGTSEPVVGDFFGQSSFANFSVVREDSVLNVKDLIQDPAELELFSPLGCGFQTGTATILNLANITANSQVLVSGLGGVGLAAIMTSKILGAKTIIAVDRVQSRLDLATELGATHGVNTSETGLDGLPDAVRKITAGGASVSVDTSGFPPLVSASVQATAIGGKSILLAIYPPEVQLEFNPYAMVAEAKSIVGSLMGDSIPAEVIPKMIEWYRQGKFPIDKLVKKFKPDEYLTALGEMHSGVTIKPVIVW